jgi:hypothetical protein
MAHELSYDLILQSKEVMGGLDLMAGFTNRELMTIATSPSLFLYSILYLLACLWLVRAKKHP